LEVVPPTYTLEKDGDPVEQTAWGLFVRDEWPSYETVWREYVVPITRRPDPGFRSDEDLARFGLGPEDMGNAQLHYTTLTHLARAFSVKGAGLHTADQFTEALVRLSAATDTADELLQRATHRGEYPPFEESREPRSAWRKANGYRLQPLRDYRNRVLHGHLVPYEVRKQIPRLDEHGNTVPVEEYVLRFPQIGKETEWRDWRSLEHLNPVLMHRDFATAGQIVQGAWEEVLAYLEEQWQAHLVGLGPSLIREVKDETEPGDEPNITGASDAAKTRPASAQSMSVIPSEPQDSD
jgi:hypothetical protein